jgi:hypothetical protein
MPSPRVQVLGEGPQPGAIGGEGSTSSILAMGRCATVRQKLEIRVV